MRFWCLAHDIALEFVRVPTWAKPPDAPSRNKPNEDWYASLAKPMPPPTAVFASVHALAEPNSLREPLLTAAHTACEHVRTLESSGVFNCSRAGSVRGENEPYVARGLFTPSNQRRWPPESVKNSWSGEGAENQKDGAPDCSYTSCWSCEGPIFTAPSWFSAPPGLTLLMGSRPDCWRDELLYRAGDIERHPGPKRTLPLRGRDVLVHLVLPHHCTT